jgi:hypothetical protein
MHCACSRVSRDGCPSVAPVCSCFHTLYVHSDEVVQRCCAKASARRTQAMLRRVLREELHREEGERLGTSERGAAAVVVGVVGVARDAWDAPLYEHAPRLFERQQGRLP